MWKTPMIMRIHSWGVAITLSLLVAILLSLSACTTTQGVSQMSFASPEEAVNALVGAVRAENIDALRAMLGPDSDEVLSSGDEVADKAGRALFVQEFDDKHGIEEAGDKAILSVGKDDWPFPIPVVKEGDQWRFDTVAGKDELLNRRIGRDELSVIEVAHAYVDAQREYAEKDRDGDGVIEFAQNIRSEQGKRDGLYWEAGEGEEPSPLGPFAAEAAKEGYAPRESEKSREQSQPYHGYFYKILTGQGMNAPGGEFSYIVNGNMLFGFGLVAYPAEYGVSGIMTFIVNQQGIVYEKDLGENTTMIAQDMVKYNPDKTWKQAESAELQ
ncbi:MAG: DUF2950 domain-containing protein [Candidatus Abyssobacteria bacterium SURF_17]|uniref:DUF2950 domain-containing protein n=1 Tax=Candidatus Abyssobacteria bacterium SURF_17 TaxID=2093361 RepID=A0A419ERZ3_9BACT|nr:MAG: DUF2950 domain-containing protein [Candidatus Abyssubacteria bacterium SURF_17]